VTFTISVTGVDALANSFTQAAKTVKTDAPKVISRGALNVKKQMQAELRESPHFKGAAAAVTYATKSNASRAEAEIGPEIGKAAGSLAFIAAFGTSRTPAWWDFTKAARDEAPNLERFLADLAEDAL
jgi:chlorite dismutase